MCRFVRETTAFTHLITGYLHIILYFAIFIIYILFVCLFFVVVVVIQKSEENIWKLLEQAKENKKVSIDELYAVFIYNESKSIPIWYHKKCLNVLVPNMCEYHAIVVHKNPNNQTTYVYDLDTLLSFPEIFQTYVRKCFLPVSKLNEKYTR